LSLHESTVIAVPLQSNVFVLNTAVLRY